MAEGQDKYVATIETLTNKRARSIFFLFLSALIILGVNSMLPVIQGDAHYTAQAIDVTYSQYKDYYSQDDNYQLTWGSDQRIALYLKEYIKENPQLTEEDKVLAEPPNSFPVKMYTKFFYQHTFWYVSTMISLASAVILFYSLFNYLIIVAKDRNARYNKLDDDLVKMSDESLDPDTFEPWVDNVFNAKRKINQHKSNVKYDLDVLEHKTSYEIKRRFKEYYKETDEVLRNNILDGLTPISKKEWKYFTKKQQLLELLEPEYINEYVMGGRVQHFKYVHPMFIYNGTNEIGRTTDSYSNMHSDASRLALDARRKITISLTVTLVFATLFTITAVGSVEQSLTWFIISIISKIAPLLIQIPMAFDYSNNFMNKHLIANLLSRRAIGLLYLADMEKGVSVLEPIKLPVKEVVKNGSENQSGSGHENPQRLGDGIQEQEHRTEI